MGKIKSVKKCEKVRKSAKKRKKSVKNCKKMQKSARKCEKVRFFAYVLNRGECREV